jgi:methyl-accepting chemotaxis protein
LSISERIQQTTDALGAIQGLTERKFLAIGNSIEQAVVILARLAATFEALVAAMQSDTVIQAQQNLALATAEAATRADAPATQAAALERLAQVTNAINVRITAMRQIARDVDMLAINARLMSAGMGEAGDDFLGFADEIRRSARLAQDTLEQIGRELTNAGKQLAVARAGVMAFGERHGGALRTIPQRLAAAVETFRAHDRLAAAAATTVGARTANIHQQVGGMIVELQLGDITRQRIEHMQEVAAVLLQLASPVSVVQSEWQALSPGAIAALLRAGCNLAAAQLRDTAGELDREAGRVANGLSQLAADAQDIGSLGEQAYGAADQHHRGFMAELEENLRATEALFEGLTAAREDTERHIADVLTIAHRLTRNIDTLRDLEADIRIMGLNTTLKCGRLGVIGRPLSVIAQELRDCGSRTAGHADAALIDLKQLAELAGTLGADEAMTEPRSGTEMSPGRTVITTHGASVLSRTLIATRTEPLAPTGAHFGHDLLGAVDLLGSTGRSLSDALAGLDTDSAAASELLQAAARDFSVRHDLGEVLNSTADQLSRIAADQAAQATTETTAVERLLGRFSAIYTMAREREVHARSGGLHVQESDPLVEPDLADVLF